MSWLYTFHCRRHRVCCSRRPLQEDIQDAFQTSILNYDDWDLKGWNMKKPCIFILIACCYLKRSLTRRHNMKTKRKPWKTSPLYTTWWKKEQTPSLQKTTIDETNAFLLARKPSSNTVRGRAGIAGSTIPYFRDKCSTTGSTTHYILLYLKDSY